MQKESIMIFYSGSICYPFIHNTKDIDIFFIVKEKKSKIEYYNLFLQFGIDIRELHLQKKIDLHFVTLESVNTRLFVWQNRYIKILYNPTNIKLENDVFKYKNNILSIFKSRLLELRLKEILWKEWYYIYTTLCFLKNNSYTLTEEQIKNINILHDRKKEDSKQRLELKSEIIKEIELWQI